MQAILELLIALLAEAVKALCGLILAIAHLLFYLGELCVLTVTQGLDRAKERARQGPSPTTAPPATASAMAPPADRPASPAELSSTPNFLPTTPRKPVPYAGIALTCLLILAVIGLMIYSNDRTARIERTKFLVKQQAQEIAETLAVNQEPPARGPLPLKDRWGQPLELFLDDLGVATLIVVRSAGPDWQPGTHDDLLGIQLQAKPGRQLAGVLKAALEKQLKEKVDQLLK